MNIMLTKVKAQMLNKQRWAAILKNVSFKAIQIHNFREKNRIKRYNFLGQNFFH
jgi:phosphoribosylanthranilate isomerase